MDQISDVIDYTIQDIRGRYNGFTEALQDTGHEHILALLREEISNLRATQTCESGMFDHLNDILSVNYMGNILTVNYKSSTMPNLMGVNICLYVRPLYDKLDFFQPDI